MLNKVREIGKSCFKNRKGFTLIELMMVIAVIGILAAVLIPKIGATKDNAKLTGVEANARQVEAHVEGLIERYRHNANAFDDALIKVINRGGSSDTAADSGDIANPFVNTAFGASSTLSSGTYAVKVPDPVTVSSIPSGTDYAGSIYVETIKSANNIISVTITPYDGQGNKMITATIVKP